MKAQETDTSSNIANWNILARAENHKSEPTATNCDWVQKRLIQLLLEEAEAGAEMTVGTLILRYLSLKMQKLAFLCHERLYI